MKVSFADDKLHRLWTDESFSGGFPDAVVKAFRKRLNVIFAAPDERVFYGLTSLHFEKLKGRRQQQCSMRLNKQYRLILELVGEGAAKRISVVGIEDYH